MQQDQKLTQSARLLFALTAFFWCAQYSYTHFINPELERMGMNAVFMGMVSSVYGLTQTVVRIPAGIMADRIGRQKPFVVAGCLITALVGAIFLLFYNPGGFFTARALAGIASASWVSFTVLYSSYFSHEQGPRRISQLNSANMGGRLIGFSIVLFAAPLWGRRFGFILSMVTGSIALVLSLGLKENTHTRQGITLKDIIAVSRDRYLKACALVAILTQALAFSTYYGFSVNLAKNIGAGEAQLSLLNISLLLPTLLFNYLLTGRWLRLYHPRALVALGFLGGAVYCVLMPLAPSMPYIYLLQVLAGLTSTLTFALLLGQCVRDIPAHLRAVAMGFYQAVYGIGMTLGPLLMGLMVEKTGLSTSFYLMAAFALASSFTAYRLMDVPRAVLEQA